MKIGVFGNDYQSDKLSQIQRLFNKLNVLEAEIYVKREFYDFLTGKLAYQPLITGVLEGPEFDLDLALSVGGDGTFLRTAEQINNQHIPVLGINTGRLGFLADVGGDQIEETLDELFLRKYQIEERMLLQLQTVKPVFQNNCALNDIAIIKRDTSSMITIHTYLNDDYLTSYQADGLIIATPTGSTAYSMSVNGPIILPQCDNIVLTPVAPHSLNVRPLVISGSSRLTFNVESRTQSFLVSLDGRSEVFSVGMRLDVCKASFTMPVVKRCNQSFYQILREKLLWGVDRRVK
ncbi:MAG: NAD kinase [Tannerella sp.]|nr:NAD kinase [Tannerella sp.]